MLTIGKLGAGQERYYVEKVADGAEDYYSGEGEAPGRWAGDAAGELGLEDDVSADELRAMLAGKHPSTGEPLIQSLGVNRSQGPVPGFDLTFSAPKSVSLLSALGDDGTQATVREAHERSVDAALGYMQREACWARRGKGGAEFVRGNGYIAAAFRHRSSRAGDPQLHTHVLIANATKGPDGRWTRLFHPAIYDHAKTAGYVYEAQLRHELSQELGVRWQPVRRGIAELAGFTDAQLRRFSTRRAEILEVVGGPEASRAARQTAALATRRAKDYSVSATALHERWRDAALEVGLSHVELGRVVSPRAAGRPRQAVIDDHVLDRAVVAERSHFERRDVVQAIAQMLPDGAQAADLERVADEYLASASVVRIADHPRADRYTTRRIFDLEREALAAAERLRSVERGVAGEAIASSVIAARPTLKDDQREMVSRLLAGGEGLSVVIGEAGTGKSFATVAAAEGWARAGIPLRVAAPTRRAVAVLSGEGLTATSVTALLGELDGEEASGRLGLSRGSVLLVDEAAMVGSADLVRLIHHTEAAEGKLVLIGDFEQLGELEAGGLFRALTERTEPISLTEVIRHRHGLDRDAAKRIREGRGAEALELYRSHERVVVAADPDAKRAAMVADWWEAFSSGQDALMVAKRRAEVAELNASARQVLREAGGLGADEIEVGGERFAPGDLVVTRVNSARQPAYNRERWRVVEVDADASRVELQGIDSERQVSLDAGYLTSRTPRDDAPALQHCYAATIYVAQGSTVDRAFIAVDPSMERQQFYAAMTRTREETHLYAVAAIERERVEYAPRQPERGQLEELRSAIERDGAQVSATDEAIRATLDSRSTTELVERRAELYDQLAGPERTQAGRASVEETRCLLADTQKSLARAEAHDRPDLDQLSYLRRIEERAREELFRLQRDETAPRPSGAELPELQAELAMADSVLAERRRRAITAARIWPPEYVRTALGDRPSEPAKLAGWEEGLQRIERYRQDHAITDRGSALGKRPDRASEHAEWQRTTRRVEALSAQIGGRQLGREIGIEREISIGLGR
jgi:conjugative relaxase-like TrwC/TraI family protein